MADERIEIMRRVTLFEGLSDKELAAVAGAAKERRYDTGDAIVNEGESGVGFFVIADGTASVTVDGGEVRTLGQGDYFGEIALLAESPRTATVTAETDLICWGLVSWAFRPIVEANGSIAWKLLRTMARLVAET